MKQKTCIQCNITKRLEEFAKSSTCKSGRRGACKVCRNEYHKIWRKNNPEKNKQIHKKYRQDNKMVIFKQKKQYYQNNRDTILKRCKQYRQDSRKALSSRRKAHLRANIWYKLADNLRHRLNSALRGSYKSGSAVRDLGCSIEFLKKYLEVQFRDGMNWNNHGEWHIDHIQPLASFNLTNRKELLKACHYTNLQPLWKGENLSKGDR